MHTHRTVAAACLVVSSIALAALWRAVDPLALPPEAALRPGPGAEEATRAPAAAEGQVESAEVVTEDAPPPEPSWERVDRLIADILETGESAEGFAERLGEIMVSHTAEFDAFVDDFVRSGDYRAQPVTCSLIAAIVRHHPQPSHVLDTMALEADEDMAAYLDEAYGVNPVAEVTDEDLDALQGLDLADLEDPDSDGAFEILADVPEEEALVAPVAAPIEAPARTPANGPTQGEMRRHWMAETRVRMADWRAACPFGAPSPDLTR